MPATDITNAKPDGETKLLLQDTIMEFYKKYMGDSEPPDCPELFLLAQPV